MSKARARTPSKTTGSGTAGSGAGFKEEEEGGDGGDSTAAEKFCNKNAPDAADRSLEEAVVVEDALLRATAVGVVVGVPQNVRPDPGNSPE